MVLHTFEKELERQETYRFVEGWPVINGRVDPGQTEGQDHIQVQKHNFEYQGTLTVQLSAYFKMVPISSTPLVKNGANVQRTRARNYISRTR